MFDYPVVFDTYFNVLSMELGFSFPKSHFTLPLRRNPDNTITAFGWGDDFDCVLDAMVDRFDAKLEQCEKDPDGKTWKRVTFRDVDRPIFSSMLGLVARGHRADLEQFLMTLPTAC